PTAVEYTIRGTFPVYSYRQANALLAGLDLHTQWNFTKNLSHSLNAAYVYGTNTQDNAPLIDMPPLNLTNTVRFSNEDFHNFFAEVRSEAVFTQTRYPDFDFNADVPVNGELVATPVNISKAPKGYQLVHLSTGMQFAMGKMQTAVNLSVFNLFNTTYRDYLNRQRLYTDEVGRNIQLQVKFSY
ncbi:MAG: TonB-dependent receptor, partial [Bacteroidota bacterium]